VKRLARIGARSKPKLGCVIGKCFRMDRNQLFVASGRQPAPMPRFSGTSNLGQYARELRSVVRIVRGVRQ